MQPSADRNTPPHSRLPQRKVFDVMRPGRAPANPTSKPVITRTPVQDTSVTVNGIAENRSAPQAAQPAVVPTTDSDSRRIEVFSGMHRQPPIEVPNDVQEEEIEEAEEAVVAAHPEPAHPLNVSPDLLSPESQVPAASGMQEPDMMPQADSSSQFLELPPEPSPSAGADDMDIQQVDLGPSAYGRIAPAVVAHDHTQRSGSKLKVIVLLLIIVLLGLAIFDIMLDAGFFVLKGAPHTSFFSQ